VTKGETCTRSGQHYRVVDPSYADPLDTSYAKAAGGRWNPRAEFGALYLCVNASVAAANARQQHAGRAIKLFDLLPDARPELVTVEVPRLDVVDAVSASGIGALGLPATYPFVVPWPPCQAIARTAFAEGLNGVAARSNAESTSTSWVGEELAAFDSVVGIAAISREAFNQWYPDPIPGSPMP
jgi:RES domain-containing protein